jgi:hypothetical protein
MPARLLRPLRNAIISGVAIVALLVLISYVRARTPDWPGS